MKAFKALRGAAVPACAAVGVLVPLGGVSAAGAAGMVSRTFTYAGAEQTFTVPAGVFGVQVLAVGGSGGNGQDWYDTHLSVAGGAAAQVSGELSVTPGEALYVEVGGNGQNRASEGSGFPSGGYNGGGNGGGGGGGGASDVRTSPRASGLFPGNRLLVAAGGGGGGTYGLGSCIGGAGGAAGQPGQGPDAEEGCREDGGGPATQSSGGAPVTNARCPGQEGQFGIGGDGGPSLAFNTATCRGHGGGGGGGYYGGGGGGGGYGDAGGGGGGGSSLVPPSGSVTLGSSDAQPQVLISYTEPSRTPPTVMTGAASAVAQTFATLNATVNPNGGSVTDCHFDYGITTSYGSSVPCSALPGSGTSAVAVSAPVGGLSAGTTYYFRIVATNSGGTGYGADQALTTLLRGQGVLGSQEHKAPPVPTVANAAQSNSTWSEGNKFATFSRKKPPVGTTFSFILNEQARVSLAFTQQVGGRKVKGKCVAQTKENRRKPSCKRTVTQGTLSFTGHGGSNKVSFRGRISASKKLPLGRYTLVITATNAAGQRSSSRSLSFTIVK